MIKKRIWIVMICLVLLLTGCSPRLVSEAKAKEVGLAMIHQAYGADLADAVVTAEYHQGGGVTYEDGEEIHYGTEEPMRFYNIRVNPGEGGSSDYFAVVNAVTGIAYRAEKSRSFIPRSAEQLAQAAAIGDGDELPVEDFEVDEAGALQIGEDWVRAHFEPDIPVLRTVPNSTMTDSEDFPLFFVSGFVIFIDGTIYSVEVCWPAMEVIGVYLCNQEY